MAPPPRYLADKALLTAEVRIPGEVTREWPADMRQASRSRILFNGFHSTTHQPAPGVGAAPTTRSSFSMISRQGHRGRHGRGLFQ